MMETAQTSSTEFSSSEFSPFIGRLFQTFELDDKQAEETAFLSLTRPSSNGERANGSTLTWRDLSVYVTAPSDQQPSKAPFKRVLNNVRGALQPGSLVALMGAR